MPGVVNGEVNEEIDTIFPLDEEIFTSKATKKKHFPLKVTSCGEHGKQIKLLFEF